MRTRGSARSRSIATLTAGSLLAGGFVLGAVPGTVAPAAAAPGESQVPITNPDLETKCGIDINVVLDESGSVKNYKGDVQRAFRAFTSALKNTGSRLAVSEFSTVARLPLAGTPQRTYTPVTDATIANTFEPYIANEYNPGGTTNWEDGLRVSRYMLPRPDQNQPHLVVFITDGNPNRIIKNSVSTTDYENKVPLSESQVQETNEDPAANNAVPNANGLKSDGSHILALAVGDGLSGQSTLDRLIKISGPDVFDGTGTFDISTTDVYKERDFSKLEAALREAAFQLCAPSITVRKVVDLTPDKIGDDAQPGPGFDLTAVASPTPSAWTLPADGGTPANPSADTAKAPTDGNGFVNFQWQTSTPTASSVTITEEDPSGVPGYPPLEYYPGATTCTVRTPEQPIDQPLPTSPVALGFSANVPKDAIVTCTILNAAVPAPGLSLEKFTNGFDADLPPGPEIPAGQPVTWEYKATNTGNVTLSGLSISDKPEATTDPVPVVTCPVSSLPPGDSTTCTATGTARPGNYENTATATATASTGGEVTAIDPSHYFGPLPKISIVKKVNGVDANDPTGPVVKVPSTVNWTYDVTNTGNVPLTDVDVTDDQGVTVTCLETSLAVGESMTCTASGPATAGQYANIGTATALGAGRTVNASDPAHYFGADPSIDIEKSTNGVDADTQATAPQIPLGQPVEWTYVVTNNGNVDLSGVVVTDDVLGLIACPSSALPVGDSFTCTVTDDDPGAQAGRYANLGTATGTDPLGAAVSDRDPSHYFGSAPGIDVEKATNGLDADAAPGPLVKLGDPVEWTYVVTNTGNEPVSNIAVDDDREGVVTCPATTLAAGASMTCTPISDSAIAGQYENLATVTGEDPRGAEVSDSDPSHYFGAEPKVDIEKSTNGQDADAAPGPYVPVGDPVRWLYRVTNTGNIPLVEINVSDSVASVRVVCPRVVRLAPSASLECRASSTAVAGQYENVGSVTATGFVTGQPVTDSDFSHYFGSDPSIDIEKATNGNDSDLAPGQYVPVGDAVNWTYVVTNTGNLPLTAVEVVDQPTGPSDLPPVVTCPSEDLAVGASVTCRAAGTARAGEYENTGTATGVSVPDGRTVTNNDPSHYFGTAPAASIKKYTNGEDADTPTGPLITLGDPVLWTYVVANTGNVALEDVTVSDDQGVEVVLCLPLLKKLPPGKSVTCFGDLGTALAGQYANVGKVTAVDLAGTPIGGPGSEITDPSHYFGVDSAIDIEKATNGQDADNAPGPYLPVGSAVTWTYLVTNIGNTVLTGLVVEDTVEGVVTTCPQTTLSPAQSITCTQTGTAIAGQYTNSATATAVDPVGQEVTDNDPSNYFGATSGILIEKSTNGDDSDTAPGALIKVGDPVEWAYQVINTGNTSLTNVVVSDDLEGPVDCGNGLGGAIDLEPFEIVDCAPLSGTSVLGQYGNVATVSGVNAETQEAVDDTDPSHYFGYVSSIDLQKSTNGEDADTPTGPFVPVGGDVAWNYVVTNTGNIDILSFTVKDSDPSVVIACPTVERILPGKSVTCVASGKSKAGQYQNTGTVEALDVLEQSLSDTDPSHYFGAVPAIDVEKATNGEDADAAPGPRIPIGDQVTWTYVVTNKGNTPLTSVTVTDDKVGAITCPATTLAPAATMTCTAKGTAQPGQYANLATVTGQFVVAEPAPPVRLLGANSLLGALATTAAPITVTDTDPSHYFGVGPAIQIVKSPDNGEVPEGDPWTFTIRVTNIGEVPLVGVVVSDPLVPACDRSIGNLAPGASTQYDCVLDEVTEDFTNVAYVEGRSNSGIVVTDDDDAQVSPAVVDETGDENGEVDDGEDLADTGADVGVALLLALLGVVLIGTGMRLSSNRR